MSARYILLPHTPKTIDALHLWGLLVLSIKDMDVAMKDLRHAQVEMNLGGVASIFLATPAAEGWCGNGVSRDWGNAAPRRAATPLNVG